MPKPTYEELEHRVKTLNCLFGLSRLEDKTGETLKQLLQETAYLIPSSWQYPDIAWVRISVGGEQFTSGEFEETSWKQAADIKVHGEVVGTIEVYYSEERPPLGEGPFSEDERLLLDAIAERLGRIIERRQAEEALDHEFAVDEALSELYKPLISASATMEEISAKILDQALQLTGSAHGYVSSIDAVTGDNICHTFTEMLKGQCNVAARERRIVFPIGEDGRYNGLCGQCLNSREPFFTNSPSSRPASGKLPEGHIPLEQFLSVPVVLGEELVGQISLANKEEGYTPRDLEAVNRLAEYYALAIRRMRDREALQEAHDALERRVKERTAELEAANEHLNREIEEREAVQEELRLGEERFRAIADYTYGWESWVAPDGKLIWTNPAVERITGYTREEYMSHTDRMSMVMAGDYRDDMIKIQKEALDKQLSGDDIPFCIRRKDGSQGWASVSFQPIYATDGKYLGLRSSIRDISARKQAEEEREKLTEQLREAQKTEAVGTLAGGIAHDFNNILSVIVGYTQLAKDVLTPDSQAAPMLDSIVKASDRAKDLIEQILAFSRESTQKRKPLQIPPVIEEVVKLLNSTIPKSIVIQRDINPGCGTIMGDPSQIHQVLMNLCTNAYHAMREYGGTLTLSLKPVDIPPGSDKTGDMEPVPGAYVKLEVGDTGKGMSQTVLERIFDPYFTTKKKGEGTGLGLAVVQGIVKSHNGFLRVSSTPGEGTTFSIYLPRLDVGSGVPAASSSEPLPGGNERVLFVDDEEHLVNIWSKVLEKLGYRVTATTSSVEALEVFRAEPGGFDLVITDMNMPHLTGSQLARSILEHRADIPVVLCTGYSEMIGESEAKRIGFREYIMKPVLREDFARTIRKVLDE